MGLFNLNFFFGATLGCLLWYLGRALFFLFFNLRTGKAIDGPEAVVVSDLDAMIAQPIAFRLQGKIHHLNPITVKEFFAYSNALLSIERLKEREVLKDEDMVNVYHGVIHSVCDSITKDDIKNMTHAQAAALLKLIIDHVTGKASLQPKADQGSSVEKKN